MDSPRNQEHMQQMNSTSKDTTIKIITLFRSTDKKSPKETILGHKDKWIV